MSTENSSANMLGRLRSGSIILGVGKLLQITLLTILAIQLDAKAFGILALGLTVSQLLALALVPGGQAGVIKLIAAWRAEKRFDRIVNFVVWLLGFYFVIICAVLVAAYISTELFEGVSHSVIMVVGYLFPVIFFSTLREAIFRGFSKIGQAQIPHEVLLPILLLLVIVTVDTSDASAASAALCWCVLTCAIELSLLIKTTIKYRLESFSKLYKFGLSLDLQSSLVSLHLSTLSKLLLLRSDVLVVGALLGVEGAGIYALAQRYAMPLTLIPRATFVANGPLLASAHATKNLSELRAILKTSFLMCGLLGALYFCACLLWGEMLFKEIGISSQTAPRVLAILALALFIDALTAPFQHYLNMTGHAGKLALANSYGLLAFIVAIFLSASDTSSIAVATSVLFGLATAGLVSSFFSSTRLKSLGLTLK